MCELVCFFKLIWWLFIAIHIFLENWQGIVALVALGLALWQFCVLRKHNRLSVRPYLTAGYNADPADTSLDKGIGAIKVEVINNGIGPAIINDCFIEIDGKKVPGSRELIFLNAIKEMFPNYKTDLKYFYMSYGYAMAANENREIFNVTFLGPEYPSIQYLKEMFEKRADLKIDYECLYKKQLSFSSLEYMKKTSGPHSDTEPQREL